MSELSSTFGTALLTSKSPEEAAQILSTCLSSSNNLIERNLLTWFNKYGSHLQRQNAELQDLLNHGGSFFDRGESRQVFGSFPNVWNTVLNSIQVRIHSNELLYKSLKIDVIGPLKDAIERDVRYSELLVNSRELTELSGALNKNVDNAEYQWNIKAPQIFDNFENFKKHEMQLLFDVVLNFFNSQGQVSGKQLSNDETTVNHLLGRFKIEKEMDDYLRFLLNSNFKPSKPSKPMPTPSETSNLATSKKRFSSAPKLDNASIVSSSSAANAKKSSKLKSRVGSIFGRKPKGDKITRNGNDSIAEVSSTSSGRFRSKDNLTNSQTRNSSVISNDDSVLRSTGETAPRHSQAPPKPNTLGSSPLYGPPATNSRIRSQSEVKGNRGAQGAKAPQYAYAGGPNQSPAPLSESLGHGSFSKDRVPSDKSNPNSASYSTSPQNDNYAPPDVQITSENGRSTFNANDNYNAPNLVKYSSDSSDEEDEPRHVSSGRRKSLLEQHNLAPNSTQGRSGGLSDLSRPASTGIYSFESGDDRQPISAFSRHEANKTSDEGSTPAVVEGGASGFKSEKSLPSNPQSVNRSSQYDDTHDSPFGNSNTASKVQEKQSASTISNPPPPPPSRKVVHKEEDLPDPSPSLPGAFISGPVETKSRRDVQSQMFHNLPSTRDSIINPPPSLVSQNTGSSQMRQTDFFKHFDASNNVDLKGLNSSIAEVMNVNFKDGELSSSQIIGEIAFNYNPSEDDNAVQPHLLKIPNSFDKIILNNTFMEQVSKDTFKLNPSAVISKTLGGLKYLKRLETSQVPLLIHQIWKFEDHQASLMISLKLNPNYASELQLKNVVVSVALNPDVEVSSASSRPQGSFNKEKSRITWRYNAPLNFSSFKMEEKLISRFMTSSRGSEHESGIQVKFQVADPPLELSKISSMSNNSSISCTRNLITGSYNSHS